MKLPILFSHLCLHGSVKAHSSISENQKVSRMMICLDHDHYLEDSLVSMKYFTLTVYIYIVSLYCIISK